MVRLSAWGSGNQPKNACDFQLHYEPGLGTMDWSDMQARVIAVLWAAREEGLPGVREAELVSASGSAGNKLRDIFKNKARWQEYVLNVGRGLYSLPPIPDADAEES
jgi:hypothetical protein